MSLSNTAVPFYYGKFREEVLNGEKRVNRYISMEMNRIDALIENGVDKVKCYIDSDSKQKSTALFNNYKDGFISKKDECKVIKQIIDLNPYRKDIYEYLIKEDGDILKDIEKLTSYLGYDVSDYKDELMNKYIEKLMKEDKTNLEFLKERIIKYARYIGSSNESIYIARIDAIYTFQTA